MIIEKIKQLFRLGSYKTDNILYINHRISSWVLVCYSPHGSDMGIIKSWGDIKPGDFIYIPKKTKTIYLHGDTVI